MSQVRYFHLLISLLSLPSSFIFLATFFASFFCQDTRGIGGCVFILADLSLFEADNDCGLGNFIEKFSIVEQFLSESLRC